MDTRHEVGEARLSKAGTKNLMSLPDKEIAKQIFVEDREYEAIAEEFGLTCDYVYTVKTSAFEFFNKLFPCEFFFSIA